MSFEIQPVTGTRKRSFHSEPRAHTGAPKGPADFLCLLCFPPRRFSSQGRRPQNGSASTVKLHYFSVCCGNRSNEMGSRWTRKTKTHQARRTLSITKAFVDEPSFV